MVQVTEKALERIRQLLAKEGVSGGLRLAGQGGGWLGKSDLFQLETEETARGPWVRGGRLFGNVVFVQARDEGTRQRSCVRVRRREGTDRSEELRLSGGNNAGL